MRNDEAGYVICDLNIWRTACAGDGAGHRLCFSSSLREGALPAFSLARCDYWLVTRGGEVVD